MGNIVFIGANNPEVGRMMSDCGPVTGDTYLGFVDNDPQKKGKEFCGLPIFGGFDVLNGWSRSDVKFVNLITRDTETRRETTLAIEELGFAFANLIHPSVNLARVTLGNGIYVQEAVVLQAGAILGDNVCINSGSVVAHETRLGAHCFFAPGVTTGGLVHIGEGVLVGIGARLLPRLTIGSWSVIGAGAVVTRDVAPRSVVAGVPARTLRMKQASAN